MAQVCELTGKKAMGGNNVSHAMNKTKRKFKVNLTTKRFYIPEEDRWITLRVSTNAIKTINKKRNFRSTQRSKKTRIYKITH